MSTGFFTKYVNNWKHQKLFFRANGAWQSGNFSEAEKLYRELIALWQPDDPEAALEWNNLGTFYLFSGRYAEGEAAYRKAADGLESAQWTQTPFWLCVVYNNLGKLFLEMKRWGDAKLAFQRCVDVRKSIGLGRAPGTLSRYKLNLIEVDVRRENWQEAEAECKRILEIKLENDTRLEANTLLAQTYLGKNQLSEAANTLRCGLKLKVAKQLRTLPLEVLSDVLDRQGQFEEAYLVAKEASSLIATLKGVNAVVAAAVIRLNERLELLCQKTNRMSEALEWKQKAEAARAWNRSFQLK